jgi:hypothetical protein
MTPRQVSRWLSRIYGYLKTHEYLVSVFKYECRIYGAINDDGTPCVVALNVAKQSPLVRTILHECLHLIDPDMGHVKLRHLELEIWNAMTDRQAGNLLGHFMDHRGER